MTGGGGITVDIVLAFGYFAIFACPFLNRDTVESDEIISILLAYVWLNHHIMQ